MHSRTAQNSKMEFTKLVSYLLTHPLFPLSLLTIPGVPVTLQ